MTAQSDLLVKAKADFDSDLLEEAFQKCSIVLDEDLLQPEALSLYTDIAIRLQRTDSIAELAKRLVALKPDHPELNKISGILLKTAGLNELAITYFVACLNNGMMDPEVIMNIASAYLHSGNKIEATGYARQAAMLGSTNGELAALLSSKRILRPSRKLPKNDEPLLVAIITQQPDPREAKLAKAILEFGGNPVLLCKHPPNFEADSIFSAVHHYDTPWQALEIGKRISPHIFHICVHMNYDVAQIFVAHRPAPIIIDSYDILTGMWTPEYFATHPSLSESRGLERFCLEQTDALCNRGLQTQVLKRKFDFCLPRQNIFWPEYCLNDRAYARKLSSEDGKLHVVYSGIVHPTDIPYDWLAETLNNFGIHLHLYPIGGPSDEVGFNDRFAHYINLEDQLEFFHLHRPVSNEAWLCELEKYDVLIHVLKFLFFKETGKHYTHHKLRLTWANKWADAQDCNVFYLTHDFMLLAKAAERAGTGQGINWQDINNPNFWQRLRDRALNNDFDFTQKRTAYSVKAQAPRLINFYHNVIQNTAQDTEVLK